MLEEGKFPSVHAKLAGNPRLILQDENTKSMVTENAMDPWIRGKRTAYSPKLVHKLLREDKAWPWLAEISPIRLLEQFSFQASALKTQAQSDTPLHYLFSVPPLLCVLSL
jgi:hypothetical protein